jgi:large subunit ribosomal protein L22
LLQWDPEKETELNQNKEEKKSRYYAVLRNCPTSPRKMRLVADMIRGVEVNKALDTLKFSSKEASRKHGKACAVGHSNWQNKNEGVRIEDSNLIYQGGLCRSGKDTEKAPACPPGKGSPDQKTIQPCYRGARQINVAEKSIRN